LNKKLFAFCLDRARDEWTGAIMAAGAPEVDYFAQQRPRSRRILARTGADI
jgi:hypothetical protein